MAKGSTLLACRHTGGTISLSWSGGRPSTSSGTVDLKILPYQTDVFLVGERSAAPDRPQREAAAISVLGDALSGAV